MSSAQLAHLTWPEPGVRAWEAAGAALLAFCALALRGGRLPTVSRAFRTPRRDPLAVPWAKVALHKPNISEAAWATIGGLAAAFLVGGPAALPAGMLGAVGTLVWLARRRARFVLREKARLAAQVPPLADLFAAGLAAGLQPAQAALTVAQAFAGDGSGLAGRGGAGEPASRSEYAAPLSGVPLLAARFRDASMALLAGTEPEAAWSALTMEEATAPLAAAVIRAGRTGAPAATTVGRAARELREAAADTLAAEVRAVGVSATAPLALCFLPAFVCLGVLPTALGLLPHLHG